MTLQRRVTSQLRANFLLGAPWGDFIWGQGPWGSGLEHEAIANRMRTTSVAHNDFWGQFVWGKESWHTAGTVDVVLSRFALAAYPYASQSRPWGTFTWGVDGWGIPAVSSVFIASGEPVKKVTTAVEGS